MARPRKLWSALKPDTKKRKLAYYAKQGLTPGQVSSRYNAGTLGSQSAARGHAKTPERPSQAARHPERYPEYTAKRTKTGGPGKPQSERDRWRDRAYLNIDRQLGPGRPGGQYAKYNAVTVRANVYGGVTAESGPVPGMTTALARATAGMTEDELVEHAFPQYLGNPWYYH